MIEEIKMLGAKAAEYGMTLLYHNHDFEFIKIDGEYALDILYNEVPSEFLQTEIDTCWVNVGGENPAGYIEKYTGRAPVVHLKDFVGSNNGGPLYKLIGIEEEETEVSLVVGAENFSPKTVENRMSMALNVLRGVFGEYFPNGGGGKSGF